MNTRFCFLNDSLLDEKVSTQSSSVSNMTQSSKKYMYLQLTYVHYNNLPTTGEVMEKRLTAAAKKKKKQTDIVFLSIGGNDISPISKPEEIYHDIKSLIENLKEAGVCRVFISEILPRADFSKSVPSGLTKSKFERDRKTINRLLCETYGTDVIKFHDIRLPRDYHDDIVHLSEPTATNKNCGLRKYFFLQIRLAFCSA